MTVLVRKARTLLFLNLGWFFSFARKRLKQRVGHSISRRNYVDVRIAGTAVRLSTLTPYHHSIAKELGKGTYEERPMAVWLEEASGKSLIYDIGGFSGIYGPLAALINRSAQVVIFEPDDTNATEIRNSIRLNNLSNCRLEEAAVMDKSGEVFFSQGGTTGERVVSDGGTVASG